MGPVLDLMLNTFQAAQGPVVGRFPLNFRIMLDNWENSHVTCNTSDALACKRSTAAAPRAEEMHVYVAKA